MNHAKEIKTNIMIHDHPKPTEKVVFGFQHIFKSTPKIAARIGLALTAMSICGLGYTMLVETHPEWTTWMGVLGILGAGITTMFGKK